ncbi:hypothetical protein CB0940_09238 [Cercospora beticola]|uniref:Knr4/Smi1-like domain-containing protein n=1 Tax=Cercospora beticola TaxID=122368 RepID=A0A2G5HGB8_CERBT|nr:hypothetical protein CB0940_09238 [Cercospora beticola]PIA91579.1 hypothetical protein CB0940_09238 [Cercospora beticola]WPB06455.1 hypothetical protein RHO25_011112 [Cercospora beticola]
MRPLHEELADELLSLYRFMVTLHIPEEALKIPPPGGWRDDTIRARFEPGEKDEAVIKLLRHIPYIASKIEGYQIWEGCECNNFTETSKDFFDPLEEIMDTCNWEPLKVERGKYLATLGKSAGRNGWYIFCDVRTREVIHVDFQEGAIAPEASPRIFAETTKESFRKLDAYPIRPNKVCLAAMTGKDEMSEIRKVFDKHGWPGEAFRKSECLEDLANF